MTETFSEAVPRQLRDTNPATGWSASGGKLRDRAYWVSFWGNLALSVFKIAVGLFGFSRLLLADGLQSSANAVIACITLMGITIAEKPADEEHVYGHGKAQFILCSFLGLLIMGAATALLVISITSIELGYVYQAQAIGLFAAAVSIFGNILLYSYLFRRSRELGGDGLLMNAQNNYVGIFSSLAAFTGILGAMYGIYRVEQICAVIISLILFWSGTKILKKSIEGLMDKSHPLKTGMIKYLAGSLDEVRNVHDVRIRQAGDRDLVEVDIGLTPEMPVEQAYGICEKVKNTIMRNSSPTVENVTVNFS